jgi:hypothetical protein
VSWRVTVRDGPRVERERFASPEEALGFAERRARELAARADPEPVRLPLGRRFEPVQQVAGRIEVAGPRRARAGVDVRGDGSAEAWTGRWRRRLVEQRPGESAYDALRRALEARG